MEATELAKAFARNVGYLVSRVEGIDHARSLWQPPAEANCLNWTVGHILNYRNNILDVAGAAPAGESGELERYAQESQPIVADGPGVVGFERLIELLGTSSRAVDDAVGVLGDAQMAEEVERAGRRIARGKRLFFLYFHDTLHTGQADVLAELSR